MTEVEFVNRELAEAEAARAVGLLNQSDESKVEAWFAMLAAAEQVGTPSNVGIRGVSWVAPEAGRKGGKYRFNVSCADGVLGDSANAPATLADARKPEFLDPVVATLDRKIAERGGRRRMKLASGTARALWNVVRSSPEGVEWTDRVNAHTAHQTLLAMARVAMTYGRAGVNPAATLKAHEILLVFDDRAELIREFPTIESARAKAMSRRRGEIHIERTAALYKRRPSPGRVSTLALRAGTTPGESRMILLALLNGRSKTKLIRAVNEAARMVEQIDKPTPERDRESLAA